MQLCSGTIRRITIAGFVLACSARCDPLSAQLNPQLTGQITAQLAGRIVDEAGNGVPAATVEIWSAQARVGRTLSGESGAFVFRQHTGAIRLTVSSIGFRSQALELSGDFTTSITVVLQKQVIALPQLVVDARPLCPVRNSNNALNHLRAAASRYSQVPRDVVFAVSARMLNAYVRSPGPGAIPDSALVEIDYGDGSTNLEDTIRAYGFTNVNSGTITTGSAAREWNAWDYLELDGRDAYLFATPVFQDLHSFAYEDESTRQAIVFCPKNRSRPGVQGVITLAADTSFATASWSFTGPFREGDRAGETVFAPPGDAAQSPPVSARGSYWYRLDDTTFAQRSSVTLSWKSGPAPWADAAADSAIYAAALNELFSAKLVTPPVTLLPYPRNSGLSGVSRRPTIHPAIKPLASSAHICRAGLAAPCVVPISSATVAEFGAIEQSVEGIAHVTIFSWSRADYLAGKPPRELEVRVRRKDGATAR